MREFSFDIVSGIRNGLRRDDVQPINEVALVTVKNLRSDETGLREFKAITAPLSTTAVDWPFPQFLVGEERKILAGATSLDFVTDGGTTSAIVIRDATAPASTTSITRGGPWHSATFLRTWFLTNGSTVVWQIPSSTTGVTEWTVAESSVPMNTVCSHLGHLFVGGISTTDAFFSSAIWTEVWDAWKANSPFDTFLYEQIALDKGWVMWSSEVGGDLQWPFVLLVGTLGFPTVARMEVLMEFILDAVREGEIGFLKAPWRGDVLACGSLGVNLIVYGDRGVAEVSRREQIPGRGSNAKFALRQISKVGISSRSAVGFSDTDHLFLDRQSYLWELNLNLTFTRHDYREHLTNWTLANVVIVRDPERLEWYISDGVRGFLFDGQSLSETTIFPSTLEIDGLALTGITKDLVDTTFDVKTTWIDMSFPGHKTIHNVQVVGQDLVPGTVQVRVDYRYAMRDSYSIHGPVLLNREGIAYMYLTALQFRIRVTGTLGTDTKTDYLRVRYQRPDLRAHRGVFNASETDARAV